MYFKFFLQLIKQIKGVTTLTVHFVDENDDRGVTHTTNIHQLTRLRLNTFCAINHNNRRVHRCQRTVGIFGKILVTGGIQNVNLIFYILTIWGIIKLHHRGRYRDTTLFLNIHPVRCGSLLDFITLHGASYLNLSAKKQELLCQRSLTCVWVRDNRKGSSSFYFLIHNLSIQSFNDSSQ